MAAVSPPSSRVRRLVPISYREPKSHEPEHAFRQKIEHYAPRYVGFLGKMAFSAISGARQIEWGAQAQPFGGARAWVLPNPSGLNRSFDLAALVAAYREARIAVMCGS